MRGRWCLLVVACLSCAKDSGSTPPPRPHIIMMIADDMGWNDVGFHGADDVSTPNIDALAYSGLILNQHYTLPLCTPSRAALLTGKFPIRTGMQHLVILEDEPWGLGLEEKLLPQYLQEAGYKTHAIGKWHLGFYRKQYTPTFRGFHTHFGYWQGYHDYYNHSVKPEWIDMDGYDMHRGLETAWDALGKYSTDLFTEEAVRLIKEHKEDDGPMFLYLSHLAPHTGTFRDPLQAPYETIAKFSHIKELRRRVYAAMVSKMDDSVGEVVAALQASSMLDNSIIIFMSDNGGATVADHSNTGSNYPLRGMKAFPWEGGTRGLGAVWSPLLKRTQDVSNEILHLVDWLPTLSSLAGVNESELGDVDGVNIWPHLSEGHKSPRTEFLYNIDVLDYPYAAVRRDKWKFVNGTPHAEFNGWLGVTGREDGRPYPVDDVLNSKVASTISGYYIRKAILDNVKKGSNRKESLTEDDMPWKPLTPNSVRKLRRQAEIHCLSSENNSWTRWEECKPLEKPCLFDLSQDPCEKYNVATEYPDVAKELARLLRMYDMMKVAPRNRPGEKEADPALWNNEYTFWHDELDRVNWYRSPFFIILVGCLFGLAVITPCIVMAAYKSRHTGHKRNICTDVRERESSSSLTAQT